MVRRLEIYDGKHFRTANRDSLRRLQVDNEFPPVVRHKKIIGGDIKTYHTSSMSDKVRMSGAITIELDVFTVSCCNLYRVRSRLCVGSLDWRCHGWHRNRVRWHSASATLVSHRRLWSQCHLCKKKFITPMVIRPLDDHTYCARSAFTCIWSFDAEICTINCSWRHSIANHCVRKRDVLTFSSISNRLTPN